jgi:glutathionylspermidine synthase
VPDIADAVARYHDLLNDELGAESQAQLDDQLRRRGLFFGGRALCTVLRPRFLGAEKYRFLQHRIGAVLRAFRAAHRAAIADDRVLAQFRLEPWELEMVRWDPGFPDASPLSRVDAFFAGPSGLAITEYNAETPAGPAYNDALTEVFLAFPPMRRLERGWDVRALPARHHTLNALLESYHAWSGCRTLPRIAILDWPDVPTQSEFRLFKDYFERQGIECAIGDPRDADYRDNKLWLDGKPVDLIYKRVLLHELVERMGIDNKVLRAVRDRAVCMVNPPSCKILHKKSSLAVLGDERNQALYDAEAREAIAAHIPWTRVVEERRTKFEGRDIDLVPWTSGHKDELVLKPNDEYGGKGIVLGWEVDADEWQAALRTALQTPYIVQQRITLEREPYPSFVDGRVVIAERMVDTAPYVGHGEFVDGCLTRLSTAALLNVTAGGGSQVPTFVIERR